MSLKNIDDTLVADMQGRDVPVADAVPQYSDTIDNNANGQLTNDTSLDIDTQDSESNVPRETINAESEKQLTKEPENVDEYGTEIPKQDKVYTQAEVDAKINEAIRRRLKERADDAPIQQPPQQSPQTQQQFEYDANNADSWEVQLEGFIEHTLTKREQKQQQQQWERQEHETQAAFEVKFNQGASKYSDFESVVIGKPLTPQMVMATRGMSDPAAFIYAAAKTQASELDRISKISDPYAQAIELGRLEERMKRSRSNVSQAPRPIEAPKGDVSEKVERTWSIDDKLRQAEDASKKERMRGRSI